MTARGRRRQARKFSERLTIVMSEALRKALERQADVADRPMAEVARAILSDRLLAEEKA
jgi:hypothetical protein